MVSVFPLSSICVESVCCVISCDSVVFWSLWWLNFILTSSWVSSACFIWFICCGVTPFRPIWIWGFRWWAFVLRFLFCCVVGVIWCFFVGLLLWVGVGWWLFCGFFVVFWVDYGVLT